MNQRFSSGRSKLHGFGRIVPVPIPLDPAVHAGATVVGRDPADNKLKLYFSDGSEWGRNVFDTQITETIERLINDIFLNGFDEEDLPDPTLLENLRRYAFNNTRGLPGFVWNDQWNYLTDEARVAEIAQEVTATAIKVAEPDLLVTVGASGDFTSFKDALEFVASFVPPVQEGIFAGEIRILAGHTLTSQNFLVNQNLGWVRITSEDDVVPVNCTGWNKTTPFSTNRFERPWIFALGSVLPVMSTKFQQIGTIPAEGMSFIRMQQSQFFTYSDLAVTPDARTHSYDAGFMGGTIPLFMETQSTGRLDRFEITGASDIAVAVSNSACAITECRIRGAVSIRASLGSSIRISATDYRSVAGADSATADLALFVGANIIDRQGGWGGIPAVTPSNGMIFRSGLPLIQGASQFDGPITGSGVVGTVSQAGGVSTGAIIQRGSNSNGEFVRFADGTQITTKVITGLGPVNTANGAGFISASIFTGNFAASFVTPPALAYSAGSSTLTAMVMSAQSTTTSGQSVFLARLTSGAETDFELRQTAIGRWF